LIDAINMTLDWRKLGAAAIVTGQARIRQAGYFVPLPGPFNDFDANCEATIAAASAVLSGLHLQIDGKEPWHFRRATGRQSFPVHWRQTGCRSGHSLKAFRPPLGAMANGIVIHSI
jgi:hypothetical protein